MVNYISQRWQQPIIESLQNHRHGAPSPMQALKKFTIFVPPSPKINVSSSTLLFKTENCLNPLSPNHSMPLSLKF